MLLWLHDPELDIPADVADEVIAATESWVMRRLMLRLTSADLGRVVADLIRTHRATPPDELRERVRDYLTRLTAASTYWPGDEEIRACAADRERLPPLPPRPAADAARGRRGPPPRARYDYPPVPRRGYPIEHVLPQKWETHWPVDGLEAELDRGAHVHRLGQPHAAHQGPELIGLQRPLAGQARQARQARRVPAEPRLPRSRHRDLGRGPHRRSAPSG